MNKKILFYLYIYESNIKKKSTEYAMATQGSAMHSVLWDMDQWLRSQTKYAPDDMSEDTYKAFELCREQLREFINNDGINLD
jgi:CRISPR/Cas system-associated endonuclease Cas3-HD